jgi:hypothetical protein
MPAIGDQPGKKADAPKRKVRVKAKVRPNPDAVDRNRAAQPTVTPPQPGPVRPSDTRKIASQQGTKRIRRKKASEDTYRAPEEQALLSQAHAVRLRANRLTRVEGTSPVGDRPQNRARDMTSPEVQSGVKAARLRVKTREGKGAGTRAVVRELEGKGVIAGAGKALGSIAEENIREHGPGGMSGVGSVRSTASSNLGPTDLAVNLGKDVSNLPAQAIPAVYEPVAGAYEAAKGRPQRIKKIAKSINESDPLWNAGVAGVEALAGNSAEAKQRFKVAKQSVQEHPGFALAEAVGAKGTLGRGAGRVMRSGVAGGKVKRAASTATREPKTLPGTNLTAHREYSPDVTAKLGQVLSDRTRKPNLTMSVKDINRRVDERVGVTGTDVQPFVKEFAATSKSGKVRVFNDRALAVKAATRIGDQTGHEFVPVPHGNGFHAIVPRVALERLAQHRDVYPKTTAGKAYSLANDAFRKTVLTTSTSWAAGNVIEATMRGALTKAGPRSYLTGLKLHSRVKALDPDAAAELMTRVSGGGHYSLAEQTAIKDIGSHFADTSVAPMAEALHRFWQHPAPKTVSAIWRGWTAGVFGGMRAIERQFQHAQLGAAVRRSELLDGHTFKLSNDAVDQAANGLRSTETQVRFARAVERAYGKYSGYSPGMRMTIAHATPFIAWSLNAAKFVADVLPRDHPAALAAVAAAENATQEWRKDHGLDLWMEGSVPGWLQGSIPTKGGGKVRASRFTPFGAFGDIGGTISGNFAPLLMSPVMALKGLDWNGRRLNHGGPEGEQQVNNALTAAGSFLDSTIPVIAQAKRVHEKGINALNPFAPVKPKAKKPRAVRPLTSTSTSIQLGGTLNDGVTLGDASLNGRVKLGR